MLVKNILENKGDVEVMLDESLIPLRHFLALSTTLKDLIRCSKAFKWSDNSFSNECQRNKVKANVEVVYTALQLRSVLRA